MLSATRISTYIAGGTRLYYLSLIGTSKVYILTTSLHIGSMMIEPSAGEKRIRRTTYVLRIDSGVKFFDSDFQDVVENTNR